MPDGNMKTKTKAYLLTLLVIAVLATAVSLTLVGMGERTAAGAVGTAGLALLVGAGIFLPMIIDELES